MMENRRKSLTAMAGGLLLLTLAPYAFAQAKYSTYFNRRYEYSIDYPADLLLPQGEAPNGDGQTFMTGDKTATLKVWGEINALEKSLAQRYAELSRDSNTRRVTYKTLHEREQWFVISGAGNGAIFYQKTMVNREQRMLTMILTAPASQAATWNAHTQRIAKSFRRDV